MPYFPPTSDPSKLPLAGGTMTGTITSTLGTITANTPALTATQTWNDGAVTFKGIFLNVTRTASAADSRLLDLQLGGVSQVSVARKGDGNLQLLVGTATPFVSAGFTNSALFSGTYGGFTLENTNGTASKCTVGIDSNVVVFMEDTDAVTNYGYRIRMNVKTGILTVLDSTAAGAFAAFDASAILKLSSTTRGFLPPVMTTTQRDAIGTPTAGLVIYNSTTNKLNVRVAAAWEAVTSA